uniref:Uncharacterized protein n=1 Tax=Anguilla anguilla TaxID=7936 RepID=A0A0E9UWZ3_ANGAN
MILAVNRCGIKPYIFQKVGKYGGRSFKQRTLALRNMSFYTYLCNVAWFSWIYQVIIV